MKIIASTLDFADAPLFCETINHEKTGQVIRIPGDNTIVLADRELVDVKTPCIAFKSTKDGKLSFFDGEAFDANFSRVLKNGVEVSLLRPFSVQLAEIRHAEDGAHLKDLTLVTGVATLEKGKATAAELLGKAAQTDTGKAAIELGQELKTQSKEFVNDAVTEIEDALGAETVGKLRAGAQTLGKRLRKLGWGKLGI